jgi:hypothetical protein
LALGSRQCREAFQGLQDRFCVTQCTRDRQALLECGVCGGVVALNISYKAEVQERVANSMQVFRLATDGKGFLDEPTCE